MFNLHAGAVVGHFRIGRKLGQGGMGDVYEALDERRERPIWILKKCGCCCVLPRTCACWTRGGMSMRSGGWMRRGAWWVDGSRHRFVAHPKLAIC